MSISERFKPTAFRLSIPNNHKNQKMSREEDVPFLEGTTEIVHEERNLSLLNVRTKSLLTGSLVINVILTLVCLLLSAVIIHLTSIIRDPETESITIPEPFCKYTSGTGLSNC